MSTVLTSVIVEGRIEGQMVVSADVVHVMAYRCVIHVLKIEIDWHEELTVICNSGASTISHSL